MSDHKKRITCLCYQCIPSRHWHLGSLWLHHKDVHSSNIDCSCTKVHHFKRKSACIISSCCFDLRFLKLFQFRDGTSIQILRRKARWVKKSLICLEGKSIPHPSGGNTFLFHSFHNSSDPWRAFWADTVPFEDPGHHLVQLTHILCV